ncbi:rho guanine nucleotide exchange factor 6 isoform X2 [Corvus cornix cornix]|uniref:Rac/Cdc42 guanine nucleotide exchange factor 6 n=1 Tax=Corvus moneduloides TaxID=1196302 RepID=A0A8C3EEF0_CORMO|nr:PREDICTED: rho guanine nucleotide exchange factor 6 isoform X2 [Corvus brachyrhynchos]XP_031979652.1 rho guanine nucleotide exchange factor 6 isoform X2 [Corvus moneduloides]XP_039427749.1 rho guanine nucleotide exchange factor 6 isoform X2 [Corvus cornix cornix]XP_041885276.1 rho guanine nucleotide exchange factor 6 isoform X2 [Corvus kubaryi]
MNPEEQIVTWLISLGVLNSPKKIVDDPEEFLKTSLKDGTVLCKLINRLLPGSAEKYCLEPKNEADCISNIQEFLKGCALLKVEVFDPHDLYTGDQFSKVLSTLTAVNKATEDQLSKGPCSHLSSLNSAAGDPQSDSNGTASQSARVLRRQSKPVEMTENGSHQLVVKARFNFKQTNEDELSVNKGDIIYVTRVEEGGWWEGTLNGKTGWFPSNYVREIKSTDKPLSPKALKGLENTQLTKNYYPVVLQNILETERDYAKELQSLLGTYLRPLQSYDKLSAGDIAALLGNMEEISAFQQTLNQALEEVSKLPENQQRVGGCFMNLMPQFRSLYLTYCANHPSAVNVLTQHSDELEKFMESQGAANPGILILTTSLSKPFLRLDKYVTLLQELERHMEEAHADHEDVLKAVTSFKSLVSQCQELRKRKQLELQILSESIQRWEGEDIKMMGNVIYMSQVMVQSGGSEEKEERYFLLFSNVLLMLSASPRMSGFIYQGKLPLTGMTLTKLEDAEGNEHMFEITGNMMERITVSCSTSQDLHEWLDHLQRLTKGTCSTVSKTQSWSPHSTFSSAGQIRGPLEPPKILKPWSLSCLRPAPPLRPSAALSYKEDSSKSPKTMKKFLPKRKTERKPSDEEFVIRKSTAALEEDAQILKVIEAYCTGAGFQQALSSGSRKDSIPQVLLPEEEKIIIEETRSNGQTVTEEKSLVDTVYALKDEVKELKQENKRMKQCLEEELKSRKDLEKLVRRLLKQTDECGREDTGRKSSLIA